jgi:hypothetical protein
MAAGRWRCSRPLSLSDHNTSGNRFITKAKEQVRATTNRGKYAAATSYVAGDVVWTDDMGVGSPQVDIWMFLEAVTSPATLPAVASGDGAFLMGAYIARYQATMLKGFFNGQASTGYTTPGHPDNAVTDVTMDILPGLGSVFLYDIKFNDAGTPSASLAAYGPGYMCVNSPGTYFHPSNVDPGRYVVVNEGYNNFGQPTLAREHGYLSAIGASAAAARIPLTVGIVAGYMTDDPWTGDEVAIGSVILNGTTITEPLLALMFEGDVFPADGSPIYYRMSYVGVAPEDAEANARVRWLTAPDTATVMRIGTYLGNNQILIDTQAV